MIKKRLLKITESLLIADDVGISLCFGHETYDSNFAKKQRGVDITQELLNKVKNNLEFLKTVITSDKTGVWRRNQGQIVPMKTKTKNIRQVRLQLHHYNDFLHISLLVIFISFQKRRRFLTCDRVFLFVRPLFRNYRTDFSILHLNERGSSSSGPPP